MCTSCFLQLLASYADNETRFLHVCRYIEENYSKIRDVEREFGNLTMEMKLTAGPKKAGWLKLSFFKACSWMLC